MGEKLNDETALGASAGAATAAAATATPGGTSTAPGGGTGTEPAPTSGQGSGGGQQADQSGPSDPIAPVDFFEWQRAEQEAWLERVAAWRTGATDAQLVDSAEAKEDYASWAQEEIYREIDGENDREYIEYARAEAEMARSAAQLDRAELHEREMARPSDGGGDDAATTPARPSAEMLNPDGSRVGVDEAGRGYRADRSGQQTVRERFDQFRTGRGG